MTEFERRMLDLREREVAALEVQVSSTKSYNDAVAKHTPPRYVPSPSFWKSVHQRRSNS